MHGALSDLAGMFACQAGTERWHSVLCMLCMLCMLCLSVSHSVVWGIKDCHVVACVII